MSVNTYIGGFESQYGTQRMPEKGLFRSLTDWYFKPKFFERSGHLYRAMGVRPFKWLVMNTAGRAPWFKGKRTSNYHVGERTIENLLAYEGGTRFNEIIHAPIAASCGLSLYHKLSTGNYESIWIDALAFGINFGCTILQRYNRSRVYNTLDKLVGA